MKYYKIIKDDTFIGVVTSENFRTYNDGSNSLVASDELQGQFVRYGAKLYRDYWMQLLPQKEFNYIQAQILEISEEECNTIAQIDAKDTVKLQEYVPVEDTPAEVIPAEDPIGELTLEYAKQKALQTLSTTCRTTIENGFDLELRGETHHFSLDTQDQLNLISLSAMAQTQSMIPYHADGEMCIFYTAEEINQIVEAATAFKVYHTTYYNALKGYVNSLDTLEEIATIEYGTPIPEEYKSDVLRVLEA